MELVDLTHKKSSPWSNADAGKTLYKPIGYKLILNYYKNEII